MSLQITGVRKPNRNDPHEAISHYRWYDDDDNTRRLDERVVLIAWMERNEVSAYVIDKDTNKKVWCDIRTNQHGTKYLQTYADKKWTDNLLALPEC
jgi:hypothetical protein